MATTNLAPAPLDVYDSLLAGETVQVSSGSISFPGYAQSLGVLSPVGATGSLAFYPPEEQPGAGEEFLRILERHAVGAVIDEPDIRVQ